MTTAAPPIAPQALPATTPTDHRGSWLPTWPMVATRFSELARRRGLMITIAAVVIALPTVFLVIRLIAHAVDPKSYGPAGGSDIFTSLSVVVLYVFGFVVAALLGCTAGSSDLTDGMFRHLVITGRSRVALYLARIPAGLAIIVSAVAVGFSIVCLVCCFAAPSTINYNGANVPPGLSLTGFQAWAGAHPDDAICNFFFNGPPPANVPCGGGFSPGPGPVVKGSGPTAPTTLTPAQLQAFAINVAGHYGNYAGYEKIFLVPSVSLMVGTGLWLLLEAAIGFLVGLGLGSLIGQRTISVILMVVLEVILTPLFSTARIPYLLNVQRGIVGIATAHLEPNGLTRVFGSGGGPNARSNLIPEMTWVAVVVIVAWVVGWTAIGAWRMSTRDA